MALAGIELKTVLKYQGALIHLGRTGASLGSVEEIRIIVRSFQAI
jgi:hypothetical protein